MKIKNIAVIAILSGLFVLLSFFSIRLPNMSITFQNIVIYLAGMIFSPFVSALTAGIGSFLSQILLYGLMPTTIIWIMPHIIVGFVFSSIYKYVEFVFVKNLDKKFFALLFLSNLLLTILNTIALFIDAKINGYYTFATVFGSFIFRIIACILTTFVYYLILPIIYNKINIFIANNKK